MSCLLTMFICILLHLVCSICNANMTQIWYIYILYITLHVHHGAKWKINWQARIVLSCPWKVKLGLNMFKHCLSARVILVQVRGSKLGVLVHQSTIHDNHDSSLGGTQPIREGTHHPDDEAIFASHFHLAKRHKVWPHQQNLGTRASGWAQKTWMVHKETFN